LSLFPSKLPFVAGADGKFCVASAYVHGFDGADVEGVGVGS
jgi:hypothetical protein